jgi:hypothetical protein
MSGRFAAKSPINVYWICLDFLGFSRPNRDLSMGYAAYSGKNFSPSFSLALRGAGTGACGRGHAEGQDCSWGKLNLVSIFWQEIVVRAVPFRLNQKAEMPVEKSAGGLGPKLKPMRLPPRCRSALKPKFYAIWKTPRNLSGLQSVDERTHRIAPKASAPSVRSKGGFYDSMDAWRRGCDTDLRLFFGGAS